MYTSDDDMIADAGILGLACIRPHDIQLRPVQRSPGLEQAQKEEPPGGDMDGR